MKPPAPQHDRFTVVGYKHIQEVNRRDRWYFVWRCLSQMFLILLIGMSAWIAYGTFRGWVVWQWATGYWALLMLKHIVDFMARRIK